MNFIKRSWESYCKSIVRPFLENRNKCSVGGNRFVAASREDLQAEIEQAYFAGAAVLWEAMMKGLDPGEEPTHSDLTMAASIQTELEAFGAKLDQKVLGKGWRLRDPRRIGWN